MAMISSGKIKDGVITLNLSFSPETSEEERMIVLLHWVIELSRDEKIEIIESHHFPTMSRIVAAGHSLKHAGKQAR